MTNAFLKKLSLSAPRNWVTKSGRKRRLRSSANWLPVMGRDCEGRIPAYRQHGPRPSIARRRSQPRGKARSARCARLLDPTKPMLLCLRRRARPCDKQLQARDPREESCRMPVLALRNVSKHFGAIEALAGVDLTMEAGEIVGLMGDNGAGKSTLVKIVAGNFPPSGGEIEIAGKNVHFRKPVEARGEGIEVVYQDLALCDNLSASANIFLGREEKRRFGPFKVLNDRLMHSRARELFAELKSETRPADLVKAMSGGQRQAVAIARTRLSRAKILLMD